MANSTIEQYMQLPANDIALAYEIDTSRRRMEGIKHVYGAASEVVKTGWSKIFVPGAKAVGKGIKKVGEATSEVIDSEIELNINAKQYRTLRTQFENFMTSRGYVNPSQTQEAQPETRTQPTSGGLEEEVDASPSGLGAQPQSTSQTETNNAKEYFDTAAYHRAHGNYREAAKQSASASREYARIVGKHAKTLGSVLYNAGKVIGKWTAQKIDKRLQKEEDAKKYKRVLDERAKFTARGLNVSPLYIYSRLYGTPEWARQKQTQQPNQSTQPDATQSTQSDVNTINTRNGHDVINVTPDADGTYSVPKSQA